MIWFIGYICFGLLTAYTTLIYMESKDADYDYTDVIVWGCFWWFVVIASLVVMSKLEAKK